MAEIIVRFDTPVADADTGRQYAARVCGREAEDRLWEAWIEFLPLGGTDAVRTGTESRQPNLTDLEYWATGLTMAFLEGALERALHPVSVTAAQPADVTPWFEGPADARTAPVRGAGAPGPHVLLDPFKVYSQGDEVLRGELLALEADHLRNILLGYGLAQSQEIEELSGNRAALADLVIKRVHARVA